MRVLSQHTVEHFLTKVGDGGESDVVHKIIAEVIAQAFDEKDAEDGDSHHSPNVVDGSGNELLQINFVVEKRDGEQEDGRIGRLGFENAIEDGTDEQGHHSLRGTHRRHQDHREQQRREIGTDETKKARHWGCGRWVVGCGTSTVSIACVASATPMD